MTAMIIEFRDGSEYAQADPEVVIGEWYDRGNPGYDVAWKNNCAYLGKDPEEVKEIWLEKKKQMDDPVVVAQKLKSLSDTFVTQDIGSEILRMAFCSGDCLAASSGKSKKRFGKTIG
jgi:hypothetical protein